MIINDIDTITDTIQKNCSEAIYSEQFFDYLVRYNGNIGEIPDIFGDDVCVNRINSQYAVVYKKLQSSKKTEKNASENIVEKILEPGFKFIPKCYGLMDVYAYEKSGVQALSALPGLALTGEGVIIGFADTGIDYTLNMFRTRSGKTRIKYIWDQNTANDNNEAENNVKPGDEQNDAQNDEGNVIGHFGFGSLYTAEDIDYALNLEKPYSYVTARDENGHGTFIASVAAGGDVGIAENAEFAAVKLKSVRNNMRDFYQVPEDEPCYAETDIMLAVRFLIEVAAKEGKPLVICLGIGTSQGAHQGKSLLEKYLTYISAYRGVCVVSAVGNELMSDAHFYGGTSVSAQSDIPVEISVDEYISGFSMEVWSTSLIYLDIQLISPTGEVFSGINPRRDGYYRKRFVYEGTEADIVNVSIDSNTGVQMVFFRFKNVAAGIWTLRVRESESSRGEGFDAWLPVRQYTKGKVRFVNPTPAVTICAPGSAPGVITAAAYNAADDTIYQYSSRGFNRQGYIKPDIAASGVNVIGAFAAGGNSRTDLLTARSGSSVSSAVLAGMAALVLEWGLVKGNAPYISTEEIKQLFIQGAVRKDYLTYPDTSFGWGEVNLLNSFMRLRL
jgi:hypothetical protein